jgi:hypothetical protein
MPTHEELVLALKDDRTANPAAKTLGQQFDAEIRAIDDTALRVLDGGANIEGLTNLLTRRNRLAERAQRLQSEFPGSYDTRHETVSREWQLLREAERQREMRRPSR